MKYLVAAWFYMIASAALAVTIERPLADPAREAVAQTIFHELRCVVCEGQALAESDAILARQMRSEIRDLVAQGKSEADITALYAARYGKDVLLNPPLETSTYFLWAAPLLLLGIGVYLLTRSMK